MKQILLKSVMLVFALMCSVGLWAQTEKTVTSTFTSGSWGAVGEGEPAWRRTSGASSAGFNNNFGILIRLGNTTNLFLENSSIMDLGNITGIKITLSANNTGTKVYVQSGSTYFKCNGNTSYSILKSNNQTPSFTLDNGVYGKINISFRSSNTCDLYVKSIEVTYIPFPKVPVSNFKYATYYNSAKYVMPEGLTGMIMEESDGVYSVKTIYEAGDVVPVNTALLLNGNEGTYTFIGTSDPPTSDKSKYVAEHNLLRGTLEKATTTGGGASAKYYKLANGENGLGWYYGSADNTTGTAFTIGANKCYLVVDDDAGAEAAPRFIGLEGDDETAIKSISTTPNKNDAIYNMAGQRVGNDYKGIVIKNGNKYLNK